MTTVLSGYRKIVSFALFAASLVFGLAMSLGSANPSTATIFAAFAPTLGTGFGALMWAFRAGYNRDAQIGTVQAGQPVEPRAPLPPG